MYGTIARFTLKPGTAGKFGEVALAQEEASIPGLVSTTVYHSDSNADECWLAVVFQDHESYLKNAESPEQHQRYLELAQFFATDPEWHDGDVVYSSTVAATPVR